MSLTNTTKRIAFYKTEANKTIPLRRGPIQVIRNCTNCNSEIRKLPHELEGIINLKSYDDLVARKSLRFQAYQTIQYHPGQIDLLNASLDPSQRTIYVIGLTSLSDIEYFKMLFDHLNRKMPSKFSSNSQGQTESFITVYFKSCPSVNTTNQELLSPRSLLEKLEIVSSVNSFTVVPVIISKDHDNNRFSGLGSMCIQILEPYDSSTYAPRVNLQDRIMHLTQHIFHDMAMNVAILPTHMVAFLILFLDSGYYVSYENLIKHMNWLRETSSDNNMKLCFNGSTSDVVDFSLMVLKNNLYKRGNAYMGKDVPVLRDYAKPLVPILAFQAIVARSILTVFNIQNVTADLITSLCPTIRVKVPKDDVVNASIKLAQTTEKKLPIRKPCIDIETCILHTMEKMQSFRHYFHVEEPTMKPRYKCGWAGDSDDDDDYWRRNRDNPKMKTWLVLTQRDYRLERLNLMINSIEGYC